MTHNTMQLVLALGAGAVLMVYGYLRWYVTFRTPAEIHNDVLEDGDSR